MFKLGYNSTETTIVVGDGRVIGGGSWGPYEDSDEAALRELQAGRLIEADRTAVAASSRPDAQAAVAAFDARVEEQEAAATLEAAELAANESASAADDDTEKKPARKTAKPRSGSNQ